MGCTVRHHRVHAGTETFAGQGVEPRCVAPGGPLRGTGDERGAELRALSDSPWLQGLTGAEKGDLVRSAELRMVNRGAFLFREGDETSTVFLLIKGRVKLVRTAPDGREVILRFLGPGHPFGFVASLLGSAQRISAQVVEASAVLAWTHEELLRRMLDIPQLGINLARLTAERLQAGWDRIQELSTERVEQRVARAVMRLGASIGQPAEDEVALELLVSEQELAELAGTSPYTISRVLSHWKRLGVARVWRRRVLIEHPHTFDLLYAQGMVGPARHPASVQVRAAGEGRVAEPTAGRPSIALRPRTTTQLQSCGTK